MVRVCQPRGFGAGFTLIETLVAVSVSGVLLLSLGSVIVLASRAVPTGQETVITAASVERGIAVIQSDLEETIDIASNGGNFLVGVPDRDGDGVGEVIRYTLDGSGSLSRGQNGADSVVLLREIKNLSLDFTEQDGRIRTVRIDLEMNAMPARRSVLVTLLNNPEKR